MLVKLLQPENALAPMLVTLEGIVMLLKPAQPENALAPMLVTLEGIVMLIKPVQPWNALAGILFPPVIITVLSAAGIEEFCPEAFVAPNICPK